VEPMTEELAPLRNAVARELHAQYAMRSEEIAFADLPEIAYAIAANLFKEFRVERLPQTVPDLRDPDR
jgi:hypothetical protein